ncbi:MAG: NADP-specific glutamate dehydrogenase [Candidatus Riflebacteria bacterium]|nr:NADP-specific glutamate dehydrogenase [Candidatus Riflebacteria bacterium]
MVKINSYIAKVLETLEKKYSGETEFVQAATAVFQSLSQIIEQNPVYKDKKILERIVEPERVLIFRIPWRNERGELQINMGYSVGFNSVLGPYKGGLRFHPLVNLSILKFLGFEQIFQNALAGLLLGGGTGGSDFNPCGKSEDEIETFCQVFMTSLFRYIGSETDVPAGDIGVGEREIAWLLGVYCRLKNHFEGGAANKWGEWESSHLCPEVTGYSVSYFAEEMLNTQKQTINGKKVAVSGFGNVAWGVVKKVSEIGGKVITLSGPDGFILDKDGIQGEKIDYMLEMRNGGNGRVKTFADRFKVPFFSHERPWSVPVDIAFPCACENELNEKDAEALIKNGCLAITEGANMAVTAKAAELLRDNKIFHAPGKATNAGKVAFSRLEVMQNNAKTTLKRQEVDGKLCQIVKNIHRNCLSAAEKAGTPGDYVNGANVAGFMRVSQVMIDQGLV